MKEEKLESILDIIKDGIRAKVSYVVTKRDKFLLVNDDEKFYFYLPLTDDQVKFLKRIKRKRLKETV